METVSTKREWMNGNWSSASEIDELIKVFQMLKMYSLSIIVITYFPEIFLLLGCLRATQTNKKDFLGFISNKTKYEENYVLAALVILYSCCKRRHLTETPSSELGGIVHVHYVGECWWLHENYTTRAWGVQKRFFPDWCKSRVLLLNCY